ncbi:hypothetical protein Angca_002945, partial [Angiostrongylus cantonensis]
LKEADFEVGNPSRVSVTNLSERELKLAQACRRWRMKLASTDPSKRIGAFHGWRCLLYCSDEKATGLIPMLKAGGAEVAVRRNGEGTPLTFRPTHAVVCTCNMWNMEVSYVYIFVLLSSLFKSLSFVNISSRNGRYRARACVIYKLVHYALNPMHLGHGQLFLLCGTLFLFCGLVLIFTSYFLLSIVNNLFIYHVDHATILLKMFMFFYSQVNDGSSRIMQNKTTKLIAENLIFAGLSDVGRS